MLSALEAILLKQLPKGEKRILRTIDVGIRDSDDLKGLLLSVAFADGIDCLEIQAVKLDKSAIEALVFVMRNNPTIRALTLHSVCMIFLIFHFSQPMNKFLNLGYKWAISAIFF